MASRLVIEWTRATLRVALAQRRGARWDLVAIRSQSIGAVGELTGDLRLLLKTVRPTPSEVMAVVPREHIITRVVKFPATAPGELAQMVELYTKVQLPYPKEQMVTDFHVLRQEAGFSTVAIIACQRDLIDRQLTVLREAGLAVGTLAVSSWGLLGWYRQALCRGGTRQVARTGEVIEPCLVVNVDDTRTDLVLVAQGRILSSRSVGQGAHDWDAVGQSDELLAAEVERSRAAIRKELPGAEVRSLILTGVGPLAQLSSAIATSVALPVVLIDPREPFPHWTTPLTMPVSPVVAGGLACADARGLVDLSPVDLRLQVRHREQVRDLSVVSALLLGVLVLGAGALTLQVSRHQRLSSQLERVLAEAEPSARRVQEHGRAAEVVASTLEDRRRLARILAEVFRRTPPTVTLDALAFERTRHEVGLRGTASSNQEALEYRKQLEQLDDVSRVELKHTTPRMTLTGERTDFEIILYERGASS